MHPQEIVLVHPKSQGLYIPTRELHVVDKLAAKLGKKYVHAVNAQLGRQMTPVEHQVAS